MKKQQQQYSDEIDERELEFVAGGRYLAATAMTRDMLVRDGATAQPQEQTMRAWHGRY